MDHNPNHSWVPGTMCTWTISTRAQSYSGTCTLGNLALVGCTGTTRRTVRNPRALSWTLRVERHAGETSDGSGMVLWCLWRGWMHKASLFALRSMQPSTVRRYNGRWRPQKEPGTRRYFHAPLLPSSTMNTWEVWTCPTNRSSTTQHKTMKWYLKLFLHIAARNAYISHKELVRTTLWNLDAQIIHGGADCIAVWHVAEYPFKTGQL